MDSENLLTSIYNRYTEIGKRIVGQAPGKLRCDCLKDFNRQKGLFSVSLTIMVLERLPNEDDYGIVFSTTAQPVTHYHGMIKNKIENGLYLITDVGSGSGEIFDDIDEIIYYPDDELSNRQVLEIVEAFVRSQLNDINEILVDRYTVKFDINRNDFAV